MTIQSVQVLITKIWPPRDGKTNYNLVDSQGMKYSTNPELAEKVREGSTVLLDYEVKEFGGRPFNMTKRLTVTEGGTSMPAPSPQPYPYPRGAVFQQALSNGPPAVNTDKHIFVTGVVGRAMGSGRFDPEDIGKLTQFACTAWTEFFQ